MDQPRYGFLGGSFDPVHRGHTAIARAAFGYFQCSKFYFVPAGINPHKPGGASASPVHRLAMLQRALKSFPDSFCICTRELRETKPSFTIDTISHLKQQEKSADIFFVVGADILPEMQTWHRFDDLMKEVTICVAVRPGFSLTLPPALHRAEVKPFPVEPVSISSTEIRQCFARGASCSDYLSPGVEEYIIQHHLYRSS